MKHEVFTGRIVDELVQAGDQTFCKNIFEALRRLTVSSTEIRSWPTMRRSVRTGVMSGLNAFVFIYLLEKNLQEQERYENKKGNMLKHVQPWRTDEQKDRAIAT